MHRHRIFLPGLLLAASHATAAAFCSAPLRVGVSAFCAVRRPTSAILCTLPSEDAVPSGSSAVESSPRSSSAVRSLRRRLRRRRDAATLIELTSGLSSMNQETKYLSREVSLSSVATDMWSDLAQSLPKQAAEARISKVLDECTAGFAELGRAAQASLSSGNLSSGEADLSRAGTRAKRAIEEMEALVGTYGNAIGGVQADSTQRFDQAWRREALRAVLALERAPGELQMEVRRQRLRGLKPELRVLRLDKRRLDTITLADVRAARAAQAKLLHPDAQLSNGGDGAEVAAGAVAATTRGRTSSGGPPAGFLGGLARSLFGAPRRKEAPSDGDAWRELTAAHDAVCKAISAPIFEA